MTRDVLLKKTPRSWAGSLEQVKKRAPDCVLIVVSNPWTP